MDFRNTLSALLPEPRDDEPANLRRDILDELADHLACAYRRELLRGADPALAAQRVLERFGDPAAMARRLWFEAMRDKIMAQRMLIATCVVVMAACITAVAVSWHWMNQDQSLRARAAAEAIEANRRMSEALAQSQAANQEMLKQMRDMSQAVLHPVSPEWNPVIFKLAEDTADGPPAAGFSLTLTEQEGRNSPTTSRRLQTSGDGLLLASSAIPAGRQLRVVLPPSLLAWGATGQYGGMGGVGGMGGNNAPSKRIYRTSGSSGIVEFGAVQPGDYSYRISKYWAGGYVIATGQLNVGPGSKVEKLVVCPKTPPEMAIVHVGCSWPADLEREALVLYAPFSYRYRKLASDMEWALTDSYSPQRPNRRSSQGMGMYPSQGQPATRSVLCGPGTSVTELKRLHGLYFWRVAQAGAEDATERPAGGGGGRPGGMGEGGNGRGNRNGFGDGIVQATKLGPDDRADVLTKYLSEITPAADSPEPHELRWELGTYGLDRLYVLRPSRSPGVEPTRKSFEVLVACFFGGAGPTVRVSGEPPPDEQALSRPALGFGLGGWAQGGMGGGMGGMGGGMRQVGTNPEWINTSSSVELASDYWDKVDVAFEARRGQVNQWTVPLPDELIRAVREALKEAAIPAAKPKAKPAAPDDDN
jgi:hypothetical protein